MQYISRLLIIAAVAFVANTANAQPPARKGNNSTKKTETTAVVELTERAKSQYPVAQTPQEVDWKREIYRSLNLENEKNASLYYPVEQIGNSCNLFTLLFNNILKGNITAYQYNLDGVEQFTEENIISPVDMLENYQIYYEEGENGELIVGKSDIPSAQVLSYYIKECHYYDQHTGTYGLRVTAICPVLHSPGEHEEEITKKPMFWLNYDDIAPLLTQQYVMSSNLNNVMSMTLEDYFRKAQYEGEIYWAVNMRNQPIAQYCKDSASVKQEQEKIEQQLKDFRTNLWNTKTVAEIRQDSINAAIAAANDTIGTNKKEKTVKKERISTVNTKSTEKRNTVKKENTVKSNSSNTANRVSVRRERR